MINKLTYKIANTLIDNEYTEIIVKNKITNEKRNVEHDNIKFRYKPEQDKGYLDIGVSKGNIIFEIEESDIEEVSIDNDSVTIEIKNQTYYFYRKQHIAY